MNQGRLMPCSTSISAVPVLPANGSPPTVRPAAVPSWVTWVIIVVSSFAVSAETTSDCVEGASSSIVRPSGSFADCRNVGCSSLPSLAIVAATSAIWIGVVSSRSWPIATRPMSIASPESSRLAPS